jgi:cytidylate kinase
VRADGAIEVDGTYLTLDEVIAAIVGIVEGACAES